MSNNAMAMPVWLWCLAGAMAAVSLWKFPLFIRAMWGGWRHKDPPAETNEPSCYLCGRVAYWRCECCRGHICEHHESGRFDDCEVCLPCVGDPVPEIAQEAIHA